MKRKLIGSSPAEALKGLGYCVRGGDPPRSTVLRYDPGSHREQWDSFLLETANGNLFHTRRFLEYHPRGRFVDHSLLFFENGALVAVCAGEETDGEWSAHRFSSHGGLAVLPGRGASRSLGLVWSLLRYAVDHGWKSLRMRFAPDCLSRESVAPLFWALSVFGFRQESRELTWCVMPRARDERELRATYDAAFHRSIRKAERAALSAAVTDDFQGFWRLLEANLQRRFGVRSTHSLEDITKLRKLCPGELALWGVHDSDGRLLAGSVVFDLSTVAAHTFYFAQEYEFQGLRPMALLMHHLCLEHTVRQKKRLNLGVITARGGQELNLGLSRFKMSVGEEPAIRPTFVLELNDDNV